ncbi:EAL domain-containing protein [Ammoniphilus sp. 3BR4]
MTSSVMGKSINEVLPQEASKSFNEYVNKAYTGEIMKSEIKLFDRTLECIFQPVLVGSKVLEVIGSAADITEHKQAEEKIKFRSLYDPLTNLPNRTLFQELLESAVAVADREKHILGVMFLDLAGFKLINNMYGYHFGDALLKSFVDRMNGCIAKDATMARMGSDEFSILLPYIEGLQECASLAEKMVHALEKPFVLENREILIDIHMGICIYPVGSQDVETLMRNAENAMYRAKENRGENIQFFTPILHEQAYEPFSLQRDLQKALTCDELSLHYQPRVNIDSKQAVSAEALLRWKHAEKGWIAPAEMIPAAEESGLILEVGKWVVQTVCKQNKRWQDAGYSPLRIAVNISVKQLQNSGFVDMICDILVETGLDAQWLELEVTESCMIENVQETMCKIEQLKSMGLKISIDDFGTGYSSLSYLKCFPIDFLKIDRSFITHITSDTADQAITATIIDLARNLQVNVVAEGVETEDQLKILGELGCDEIQGYLYSPPVPAEEFKRHWLKQVP